MAEIYNQVSNTLVTGTEDADSITNHGNQVTLAGLGGDDLIDPGADEVVVHYSTGDGNDTILNVSGNTTLAVSGMYTSMISGTAVVLTVGDGKISLPGAAALGDNLHIQGPLTLPGGSNVKNRLPGVVIEGLPTRDSVDTRAARVTVHGNGGNDYFWNDEGSEVSIDGGTGNDTIVSGNTRRNTQVTVSGGAGNDYLNSRDNYSTIDGGAGNDTIRNGTDVNSGENNIIYGGDGDDIIDDGGSDNFIDGGAGDDTITDNYHSTIQGGTGDDSIYIYNSTVVYALGDGNDTVEGFYYGDDSALSISGGTYSTNISGQDVIVSVGDGKIVLKDNASIAPYLNIIGTPESGSANPSLIVGSDNADTIFNSLTGATISALGAEDSIYNRGNNVSISGGAGNDTLYNRTDNVTMDGDVGNDFLYNFTGDSLVMNGGDGADTIINYNSTYYGHYVTINGGAGNDSIFGGRKVSSTINGGAGNDTVDALAGVYVYNAGDGNDVLMNYSSYYATISIVGGTYTSVTSGDDVILNVGTGSIRFVDANAEGGYAMPRVIADSTPADTGVDITNTTSNTVITGSAYGDYITNGGERVTIQALAGNDTINNYNDNASIGAGDGADRIENYANDSTVDGGAGNDTISLGSSATGNVIQYTSGDGNDSITGFNATSTISIAGAAYTSVQSGSDIVLGVGNGSITLDGAASLSTVNIIGTLSGGSDTQETALNITNTISNTVITGSAYADTITNRASNVTINALGGNDIITNNYTTSPDNVLISGGDGADTIENAGDNSTVQGGAGNDSISNVMSTGAILDGGAGNDTVENYGASASINGGAGNDFLGNYRNGSTVLGGAGNDTIENTGDTVQIDAGAGNDSIYSHCQDVTISGAGGNDTIIIGGDNHLVQYSSGDGNDLITGFKANSSISISGAAYTSVASGSNIILGVGNGSITLEGAASLSTVNIIGTLDGGGTGATIDNTVDNTLITGTAYADSITNSGDDVTINAAAGNDTISLSSAATGNVIQYASGDGNDTVLGFKETDTLSLDSAYSTLVSGNDLIITVGESKITLVDAASLSNPNIESTDKAVNLVEMLLKRTAAGYPVASGILLNPEELIGEEPDNYATKEDWTITSADNLKLHGICYTPENSNDKWVVLVHGYGLKLESMYPFATFYLANDYNVLMIDQRAAGKSEGTWLTMGAAESQDVALWTQEIARRNSDAKITLHGVSMGAATAMLAAARSDAVNVTSLIEDCGYTSAMKLFYLLNKAYSLGFSDEVVAALDSVGHGMMGYYLHDAAPIDSISAVKMPTLFISGDDDGVVPVSMLSELYDASGAEVKEKFIVNGAGHAQAGLNDSVGYSNSVFRFVAEANGEGWATENTADNISLRGTKYNDTLENSGDYVTINAGAGNDTIENTGDSVSIYAGAGNDFVYSHCEDVTISGAGGNDTIVIGGDNHLVDYASGDGNDYITGFNDTSTISISGAAYTSVTSGSNIILGVGNGSVTLEGAVSLDTLNIVGTLEGGDKPGDTLNNTVGNTLITGTPYADSIRNTGASVTIQALGGNDTITSNGNHVSIGAASGNDTITFTGQDVTINAGTGNDIIRKSAFGNGNALIQYNAGDGNDYIHYPTSKDTLSIAGAAYSSIESDEDLILVVEDNFITLRGAADRTINIIGEYTDSVKPGEYIINRQSNITITGTPLADTISNYGNYVTIQALASQDSIRNYGNRVSIRGGTGDDYIDNYSSLVTIEGDSGNDTINNISGNYVTIRADAGNDSVNNGGNYVTIRADAGDDTIINGGDNVVFVCHARNGGNDLIQGFKANSTLSIVADGHDSGSFTSVQSGNDIVLTFISGGNTVTLQGAATLSTVNIFGGGEVGISVNNTVNNTIVTGTDCADTLTNSGNYVTINAGKDNDTISNIGDNSAVNADDGNDTIYNGGDNVLINGGAGNDSIMSDGGGMTITGGKGDDTINSSRFGGVGTIYRYTSGDGNDFIQNFENEDTLVVIGSDFTTTRANDAVVVVTVGEGQITLLGAEGTPNIISESAPGLEIHNTTNNTIITGSDYDDTITNTGTRVTLKALGGDDYIANVVDSSVTTASLGNSISAGDGNDTIYNSHSYNPTLEGGAGDDSIVVNRGHLTYIDGGLGNDTILGQLNDTVTNDWHMGGYATILGGEGNDYIAPGYANDSSISGGAGNDTIITNGENASINGGAGNNLIQLTTIEGGDTPQYIIFNGNTTVEGFGTGFGDNSDTIYAESAPNVDFKGGGLTFYSSDKSLTLSDVTTTAKVNLYNEAEDKLSHGVFIPDNTWHNATRAELATDNLYYVGATASKNHGVNFDLIRTPLSVTLDTDYDVDSDFYVNNVYSIRGGAGNTTITGSKRSDTIFAGTGTTTINAGAGGDILSGNGKTTFNIDSGATAIVNGSAGDSLNIGDDSLTFLTDGTVYIVNGKLRRVSDSTIIESAEGDVISGSGVKNATVIDGTSESLTANDRELVIGKRGASLKGYTLDKTFIRNELDAATIIDLINATDASQLVLDAGTFYTKNQNPIVLEDYDTSDGTFVNIKTADGRKNIFGWSPLNGGIVDGNSIDKPQVLFGDAPNGNSTIRGGALNDSIYAGAKDVVSLSSGHDELYINDETSHGVTVDMGDGSAQSRTRIVEGFDVTRDLLKIDSPENINARILDGSLQFIKGDSRVTFDELATFDDANGLQVQVDGTTYELRSDYDSGLANVDYLWTDTDGNYFLTDSTFRIFDDGSTREYFIAEGSGKLTIDGFNFGRDNDKLNVSSIDGLTASGNNLYVASGEGDIVEVTDGAGKTIDVKLDGTTYTAQLGKHLTYDLAAEYYGDLHGGTGNAISIGANFAQEEVAIYLNEEEEADGKVRYYGGVTKIDASKFDGQASLVGSEFNDQIIAAQGATSLWGGESGDDELFGTGTDNSFFYCLGNGDDKIYNAADGDEVNLVDITLADITNSAISAEAVTLELSDGGRLTVMNSADVTFNLGDGTSWKADRQSKEWTQQA